MRSKLRCLTSPCTAGGGLMLFWPARDHWQRMLTASTVHQRLALSSPSVRANAGYLGAAGSG